MNTKYWDGTESLEYLYDDGGRAEAGYKGHTQDCVTRSIAIVSGLPYAEVYAGLNALARSERRDKRVKRSSARSGVHRKTYEKYLMELGFQWQPTMFVGKGCKVHLLKNELPKGKLIVRLSRHLTAVIGGVIRDTSNPTRCGVTCDEKGKRLTHRCVYGYYY